jgi:hypothetical protein
MQIYEGKEGFFVRVSFRNLKMITWNPRKRVT